LIGTGHFVLSSVMYGRVGYYRQCYLTFILIHWWKFYLRVTWAVIYTLNMYDVWYMLMIYYLLSSVYLMIYCVRLRHARTLRLCGMC